MIAEPGSDPYFKASLCPTCASSGKCPSRIKMENIQTSGPQLNMVIHTLTDYSPAWPMVVPGDHSRYPELQFRGYLHNGLKAHEAVSKNLLQIKI